MLESRDKNFRYSKRDLKYIEKSPFSKEYLILSEEKIIGKGRSLEEACDNLEQKVRSIGGNAVVNYNPDCFRRNDEQKYFVSGIPVLLVGEYKDFQKLYLN